MAIIAITISTILHIMMNSSFHCSKPVKLILLLAAFLLLLILCFLFGGRYAYQQGCLNKIKDNLIAGSGPGTFAMVFPKYQPPGFGALFRNAHNDYLHFMTEAGLLIIPIVLWLLVQLFRVGFAKLNSQSRQIRGFTLGTMTAVFAIRTHSVVVFNLNIPANATSQLVRNAG